MSVTKHRETILQLMPRWLRNGHTARLLYAIALHFDALGDWAVAGVRARYPGLAGTNPDNLPIIGRDRRVLRGHAETDAEYAERLIGWLPHHRRRGTAYELLATLFAYFRTGATCDPISYITRNGLRYHMATDGTVTRDHVSWIGGVTGYTPTNGWASWWLVFHPSVAVPLDGVWDSPGTWDDGGVWDSGLTFQQIEDYKRAPNSENTAHAIGYLVILPPGTEIDDFTADPPIWENPDACSAEGITLLPITPGARF